MGIGFNSILMPFSNVVVCFYNYTGKSTDSFFCDDGENGFYVAPTMFASQKSIQNVKTITKNVVTKQGKLSSLEVSFERQLVTSNT